MSTLHTIHYSMTGEAYNLLPGIRSSVLKAARTSPLHGRAAQTTERKPSASMEWGTLVHAAVLEQGRFLSQLAVFEGDKRTKAWREFEAANDGRIICTRAQLDDLRVCVDRVTACREAMLLISETRHEVSLQWEGKAYGLAKARLDGYASGTILEVKTARDITDGRFQSAFYSMGYHIQAGWYQEGAEACGDVSPIVYVLAIENAQPFDCRVFRVNDSYLHAGRTEAVKLARSVYECNQRAQWPGIGGGEIAELCAPAWTMEGEGEVDISSGSMEASEL